MEWKLLLRDLACPIGLIALIAVVAPSIIADRNWWLVSALCCGGFSLVCSVLLVINQWREHKYRRTCHD